VTDDPAGAVNPQAAPTAHGTAEAVVFPADRLLTLYWLIEYKWFRDPLGRRVQENASHEQLRRHLGVSEATLNRDVLQLERLGFLRREHNPPKRDANGELRAAGPTRYVLLLDPASVRIAASDRATTQSDSRSRTAATDRSLINIKTQVAPTAQHTTVSGEEPRYPLQGPNHGAGGEGGRGGVHAGRGGAGAEIAEPPAAGEPARKRGGGRPPKERKAAKELVTRLLADGPRLGEELRQATKGVCCGRTLDEVRVELRVQSVQIPEPGRRGPGRSWCWLPDRPPSPEWLAEMLSRRGKPAGEGGPREL
jgi:hypothetical protein